MRFGKPIVGSTESGHPGTEAIPPGEFRSLHDERGTIPYPAVLRRRATAPASMSVWSQKRVHVGAWLGRCTPGCVDIYPGPAWGCGPAALFFFMFLAGQSISQSVNQFCSGLGITTASISSVLFDTSLGHNEGGHTKPAESQAPPGWNRREGFWALGPDPGLPHRD